MRIVTDSKKIEEILGRGVDTIYPSREKLETALKSGRRLVIYYGIDPTASHLHLGHSTNLFLLEKFRELGHKIILLIGDFTAQIGDPTGKFTARKALTESQILENWKTYRKQAGKILDFRSKRNPVVMKRNSQWLSKLTMKEIGRLASKFTHGYMIKRSMFQERLRRKEEIYLHEFLYPLLQGYDSVAMDVDVEVGGTDQTFNMLVGRDLMKILKNKEKFVITTPLLVNPKTGRKLMSKTESFIALDLPQNEMYGKIMALPDEVIIDCFKLCTELSLKKLGKIEEGLRQKSINPREAKAELAQEIVKIYYGAKKALLAEREFNKVFKEKKLPSRIPEILIKAKSLNILDLLIKTKLASSKAEAKRLLEQKGIKIDGKVQTDWKKVIEIKKDRVLQAGKRRFVKII